LFGLILNRILIEQNRCIRVVFLYSETKVHVVVLRQPVELVILWVIATIDFLDAFYADTYTRIKAAIMKRLAIPERFRNTRVSSFYRSKMRVIIVIIAIIVGIVHAIPIEPRGIVASLHKRETNVSKVEEISLAKPNEELNAVSTGEEVPEDPVDPPKEKCGPHSSKSCGMSIMAMASPSEAVTETVGGSMMALPPPPPHPFGFGDSNVYAMSDGPTFGGGMMMGTDDGNFHNHLNRHNQSPEKKCMKKCHSRDDCTGFNFDEKRNECWLKTRIRDDSNGVSF
jgi:hypothetical protein